MFSALMIRAVGRAAGLVIQEVRRQFAKIPGLLEGRDGVTPDSGRAVAICTRAALRELVGPGLIAILTPLVVGFLFGAAPLGAFLAGIILTGQLMAVFLANSGGAWDNAKKSIEEGLYGGKGTPEHEAGVVGDTVGDPFKDTAGPAINPLIKVMNLVALIAAPLIIRFRDTLWLSIPLVTVGVILIGFAIWKSKRGTFGEMAESEAAD
jgi:K(+)-stimulated pyrophosphate-energized sodium pump